MADMASRQRKMTERPPKKSGVHIRRGKRVSMARLGRFVSPLSAGIFFRDEFFCAGGTFCPEEIFCPTEVFCINSTGTTAAMEEKAIQNEMFTALSGFRKGVH
jgi:hypothetical protein